jgi:hypothetical protein
MYHDKLPLLTKGPFALFYGGEELFAELSDKSPGRGVPVHIFGSAVFQVFLYMIICVRSRNKKIYFQNLRRSLVENVVNMYGIMAIIMISIISSAYILLHHLSIETYKTKIKTSNLIPKEVIILYFLTLLCVVLPFMKSYALR